MSKHYYYMGFVKINLVEKYMVRDHKKGFFIVDIYADDLQELHLDKLQL